MSQEANHNAGAIVAHNQSIDQSAALVQVIERAAANPEVDVEKMERLFAMHERIVGKQAEAAFNAAMSATQSEMGRISADALNPQTKSRYATYGKLDKALRPVYTKQGFALSFGTEDAPAADYLRVACHVSHRDGHSRSYHIDMPADGKGAKGGDVMTKTHATGAAASYGMRYLLKMIFNVAIGEDDDDGNAGGGAVAAALSETRAAVDEGQVQRILSDLEGSLHYDAATNTIEPATDLASIQAIYEEMRSSEELMLTVWSEISRWNKGKPKGPGSATRRWLKEQERNGWRE